MLHNNKEFRVSLYLIAAISCCMSAIGFLSSMWCGIWVTVSCVTICGVFISLEAQRYRRLQQFGEQLEQLLTDGTPLPIREYEEGELSLLSNQIQKLALELTEAAEKSSSSRQYLADSLADISHQLRTPLTSMNLTVSMLRQPNLTEEKRMSLTRELTSLLTRIDWLVETLLKLSKLDTGTIEMAKEAVLIRDLIRQAAAPLAVSMDLRDQQLAVQCQSESFIGDLVWTAEAFGNILKNCMEHTDNGGTISISAQETPLFTQIVVSDTGSGFYPADIPHLFDRFYRGSNASQDSCGIGLALARTVITAQNGTIQARNTDRGAEFMIKFYKQVI